MAQLLPQENGYDVSQSGNGACSKFLVLRSILENSHSTESRRQLCGTQTLPDVNMCHHPFQL